MEKYSALFWLFFDVLSDCPRIRFRICYYVILYFAPVLFSNGLIQHIITK